MHESGNAVWGRGGSWASEADSEKVGATHCSTPSVTASFTFAAPCTSTSPSPRLDTWVAEV